jgi:hypothetical protein
MPDKPIWLERLPQVIARLEERAEAWVDRATLEALLGVGRRRAQQLLARMPGQRVGASVVTSRGDAIRYLQAIAAGEETYYEQRRRKRLWGRLDQARGEWSEQPLVETREAQVREIERNDFAALPEGVDLAPGCITIRFGDPEEALEKLLALAMAVGRNRIAFDQRVSLPRSR